jgi:hypothetical protein
MELAILESFPFHKYTFLTMTVEHNFLEDAREKIRDILESNGYRRKQVEYFDQAMWDDLYVHKSIPLGVPIVCGETLNVVETVIDLSI